MSSGFRTMVINTQERAVSTDINRLQKFAQQDFAEFCRYLLDVIAADSADQAAGVITEPNAIETPLRGEIVNGLMIKPQAGILSLQVDPGVCFLMQPDAAPDESNYKFVRDAGISANGVLAMTANASGSARVDVIECRMNAVALTVTDNRDIFDPGTGLFAATTVTKETQGRLEYRVRAGTPGAGYPGAALGWMPLAVALVPNGVSNTDGMTFWDVRPLINDRAFGPGNVGSSQPTFVRAEISTTSVGDDNADLAIAGWAEAILGGRRIGGWLRSGAPGADSNNFVFGPTTTTNHAAGYSPTATAGTPVYLYLALPFGLPRWARYKETAPRTPRGCRGIPIVTETAPLTDGRPSAAINLPTATGLGSSATEAFCVAATHCSNTGPTKWSSFRAAGDTFILNVNNMGQKTTADTATLATTSFNRTQGTHFPTHAKSLKLELATSFTPGSTAGEYRLGISGPNISMALGEFQADAGSASVVVQRVDWMPVPRAFPAAAPGTVMAFALNHLITPVDAVIGGFPFFGIGGYRL
jgi:hypothetical protein